MASWTDYVSVVVAVIGLAQAVFLCLLLRSEGGRAFGANRWMILFIITIAFNLIEDVADIFVIGDSERLLNLFFGPINFVIAPAVYLYFREISGNPSRRPWVHFIPALIVFNLMGWTVFRQEEQTGALSMAEVVDAICWGAIFVQISAYIALLWRVACRYFRQTQVQLGADRKAMQRWMWVILGGVTFAFISVAVGRIIGLYMPDSTDMFGTEIAFTLALFAMSYETATRPVLFVMPDWPSDFESDEIRGGGDLSRPSNVSNLPNRNMSDASTSSITSVAARSTDALDKEARPATTEPTGVRPLLDEDGVERVVALLGDFQRRGDILNDPLVSMPKLARAVGVSPNQLSYVLNHHIGQNFFDFVNSARIEEARSVLLLEPDRTILDVALSVGFNSKSTFNLAFKKMTGETPSAVREAAKKAENQQPEASDVAPERPDMQPRTP